MGSKGPWPFAGGALLVRALALMLGLALPRWLAILFLIALSFGPARAEVADADRAAIQTVIETQIDAFRRDDDAAAFALASPMIQGMFESQDRFMAMVRNLYPPVYRPRLVEFGEIIEVAGGVLQKVELIGPDGAPVLALYTMIRGPDGWRINGVALTASEKLVA